MFTNEFQTKTAKLARSKIRVNLAVRSTCFRCPCDSHPIAWELFVLSYVFYALAVCYAR